MAFKICFLNCRSLHKHIEDIRNDFNYSSSHINIFVESRFSNFENDIIYHIDGYSLFRNDNESINNRRPYGGTAIYSKVDFVQGYPQCLNSNGIEITVTKVAILPDITIISIYRSPKVPMRQMCAALSNVLMLYNSSFNIFIGDFNVDWFDDKQKISLYNLFVREHNYRQIVSCYTTDNKTAIDHIYTNLPLSEIDFQILETYFTDHKSICALVTR